MLTVFSMPKPFRGHIRVIQYNAIKSWILLGPGVEVILLGDEPGTAEACRDLGVRHEPHVERNEFGTPLLNSVFSKARELASHEILCYSNCDIILPQMLIHALNTVSGLRRQFLIVGRRWDLDVTTPLDFSQSGWEQQLQARALQVGSRRPAYSIDYFAFRGSFCSNMPPFAIGRPAWDNWFIWNACASDVAVVDASETVVAVHQNHDYSHHVNGRKGVYDGEEAIRNRQLLGSSNHYFTIEHATHRLTPAGKLQNRRLRRQVAPLQVFWIRRLSPAFYSLMESTVALRRRLGLRREGWLGSLLGSRKIRRNTS
jgi:hypothetical protein